MNGWKEQAKWIWLSEKGTLNQYVEFCRRFQVEDPEKELTFHISADSRYAAFLNGQFLPISQYADYPEEKIYDSLDIRRYAVPGENTLVIVVNYIGEDFSMYRLADAGLIYAVTSGEEVLCASDEATLCRQSPTYCSGEVERVTPQLGFSFRYDATRERPLDLNDGTYCPATVLDRQLPLLPRPVAKLNILEPVAATIQTHGVFLDKCPEELAGTRMQKAFLSSRITDAIGIPLPNEAGVEFSAEGEDGIYVMVDLGREETGLLHIDVTLPEAATVLVGYGEHLDDLRPRTGLFGRHFAAVYEAKAGRQQFTYYFKRIAGRYVMLHIYCSSCKLHYAGMRPTEYPHGERPHFQCNDSLHNRIAEVSRRTLELCMHEHYEDCPWREQSLYAMDSRNQMLCGYYAFGEVEFARASIRLLAQGMRDDGLLELCAPARVGVTIPSFTLAFVQALEEHIAFTQNLDFAAEMMPTVNRILETFLSRIDETGLCPSFVETPYWNFYEWNEKLDAIPIFRDTEIPKAWEAPLQGWLLLALQAGAVLCRKLGHDDLAETYRIGYEKLSLAVQALWNEEKGVYGTYLNAGEEQHYCELTQALFVCAGAVPQDRVERVLEALAQDASLVPLTLSHTIYKYDALMTMPQRYARFVKDHITQEWGRILYAGATSFWETQRGASDFDYSGSLCHGWSAVPLYFYHHYVLGENWHADPTPIDCGLVAWTEDQN